MARPANHWPFRAGPGSTLGPEGHGPTREQSMGCWMMAMSIWNEFTHQSFLIPSNILIPPPFPDTSPWSPCPKISCPLPILHWPYSHTSCIPFCFFASIPTSCHYHFPVPFFSPFLSLATSYSSMFYLSVLKIKKCQKAVLDTFYYNKMPMVTLKLQKLYKVTGLCHFHVSFH